MQEDDRKEPTGYELQRSIDRVEKRMSEGISDIKILIAGLVSRDLFDYESKTQNEKIAKLEKRLEEHENSVANSRWRFWAQIVIPLLAIVAGVVIALL